MTEWALHTLIATSALLALVLLLRRPVAKRFGPRVAYALWLLPVLRIVMPGISLPAGWLPDRAVDTAPLAAPVMSLPNPALASETAPAFPAEALWAALLALWLVGAAVGLARLISTHRRYRAACLSQSNPPSAQLDRLAQTVAADIGLRRRPELRIARDATGPLVTGLARPLVILPRDAETDFKPEQLRLALLHETLHIRRGDLWTASVMAAARAVFWWHPLVHLAWPRFRADQEAACDAHLIRVAGESARASYAATLLRAARLSGGANPGQTGAALALSLHHPVKERLMTLSSKPNHHGRAALAFALLASAAVAAPVSFAEPPAETTQTTSTSIIKMRDNGQGFDIRTENGERTYLRVSRDGTTEQLTREQMQEEYGVDFEDIVRPPAPPVPGEPGLSTLAPPPIAGTFTFDMDTGTFSAVDPKRFEFFKEFEGRFDPEDIRAMIAEHRDNGTAFSFAFPSKSFDQLRSTEARLRSAEATLSAVETMLGDLDTEMNRDIKRAVRDAERDLEKAKASLEKARKRVAEE